MSTTSKKTQRRNVEYLLALAQEIKENKTLTQVEFVRCCNNAATKTGNCPLNHQSDGSDTNLKTEVHQLGVVLSQMGLYNTKSRKSSVFGLSFVRGGFIKANLKLSELKEILKSEESLREFQRSANTPKVETVKESRSVRKSPKQEEETSVLKLSQDNTNILDIIKKIVDFFEGICFEDLGKILLNCSYISSPIKSLAETKEYVWGNFSAFLREDRDQLFIRNLETRARADRMIATLKAQPKQLVEGKFMALLPSLEILDSLSHLPQVKSVSQLIIPGGGVESQARERNNSIVVHVICEFENTPHSWNTAAESIIPLCRMAVDVDKSTVFQRLLEIQRSVLDFRDLRVLLKKSSLEGIDEPNRLRAIANSLVASFDE